MAYSDDAAEQVVKIALEGTEMAARITGEGAKQVAILLYAVLKDQNRTMGKTRLGKMLRSGKELKVFAVKDQDLKTFHHQAKVYGLTYCVLKDRDAKDGITEIMAYAQDAGQINRIFSRCNLSTVDIASVRSELEQHREGQAPAFDPPPVHPDRCRSKEDVFLDALLTNPEQERNAGNPTPARRTDPSAPPSGSSNPRSEKASPGADRPSVRLELDRIRKEMKAEQEQQRSPVQRKRRSKNKQKQPKQIHPKGRER